MRFPLITEIFVLSEERTTPNIVAPLGSASWDERVMEIVITYQKMKPTWISHARSPLNQSSYTRQTRAADVQTFRGAKEIWEESKG